ncbi:group III truncated hemoglobin [Benzoatithermus flavus]|uniref:Group III truncated hemoglobin n=1 Tax=Benzoatithermus flavus TaxID=3108223 RepID=A0ABU8XSB1_9PROT
MSTPEQQERRAALAPGAAVAIDEVLIGRVVREFYRRVRRDPVLGPIFEDAIGDGWDAHLAKLVDFWSSVLLMTGRYSGRPMQVHARIDAIEDDLFRSWLGLFEATVVDLCTPAQAALFREKAQRIAESLRLGIAFHRKLMLPRTPLAAG